MEPWFYQRDAISCIAASITSILVLTNEIIFSLLVTRHGQSFHSLIHGAYQICVVPARDITDTSQNESPGLEALKKTGLYPVIPSCLSRFKICLKSKHFIIPRPCKWINLGLPAGTVDMHPLLCK
ncbi:hypothetical protein B0H14DRAFT_3864755 [Mycena olivaceomarginata]|nr:hypothetical protein B0H14DRAFT_3864755 [Mycena olivaceomarginata]